MIQRPIRSLTIDPQKHQEKQGSKTCFSPKTHGSRFPASCTWSDWAAASLALQQAAWDEDTNIFPDLFPASMARINHDADDIINAL